jgi:hypothetical protein
MKSLVRPELPTVAVRSSQATLDAVDNSALLATRPQSTYKSGNVVQTNGATSVCRSFRTSSPWQFRGWDALTSRPPKPLFIKLHFEFEFAIYVYIKARHSSALVHLGCIATVILFAPSANALEIGFALSGSLFVLGYVVYVCTSSLLRGASVCGIRKTNLIRSIFFLGHRLL